MWVGVRCVLTTTSRNRCEAHSVVVAKLDHKAFYTMTACLWVGVHSKCLQGVLQGGDLLDREGSEVGSGSNAKLFAGAKLHKIILQCFQNFVVGFLGSV